MKTYRITFTLMALLMGWGGAAAADSAGKVRYQIQVFRLTGDFNQETSLRRDFWAGSDSDWSKIKDAVTLFDYGEFILGRDRLLIHRRGCFWNDTKLTFEEGLRTALPEEKIKLIYSPNLMSREGELVRMKIESRQPFQFMSRREDGLFELKETTLPVGMDIEIKAERKESNVFRISYLELELRTVSRRKKVQGTHLPVGLPQVDEFEYILQLVAREEKNLGILLHPRGAPGAIILRIALDDE